MEDAIQDTDRKAEIGSEDVQQFGPSAIGAGDNALQFDKALSLLKTSLLGLVSISGLDKFFDRRRSGPA